MSEPPLQPYIGLRTYEERDAAIFFGRERESVELLRLIDADTISILYGLSGVGKSSLLRAGLLPRLHARDIVPAIVRLDHDESADSPKQQVLDSLHAAAVAAGVLDLPAPKPDETLWEYFHHPQRVELWTIDHRLLTPLLALDQFEEFFSLGEISACRRGRGAAFRTELLDLLGNRPPATLDETIAWHRGPVRWRLLLVLREDFVAQLLPIVDELATVLPSVHRQKLRLLPFDTDAVREVVECPWTVLGLPEPEPQVALAIASHWRAEAGGVAPAQLSLLLTGAQEKLARTGAARVSAAWFTEASPTLLVELVDGALSNEPPTTRHNLENEFLSRTGYRVRVPLDDITIPAESLNRLIEHGLLAFYPGQPDCYELVHDLLCPILRQSRDERRSREAEAEVKREAAVREHALIEAQKRAEVLDQARRRAVSWAVAAFVTAIVAIAALVAAQAARDKAIASRSAADELISYMQYDLRDTLKKVGRISLVQSIGDRIALYRKDHPPEAGDLNAERERAITMCHQGDVLLAQGKHAEALEKFRNYQELCDKLTQSQSKNNRWQSDLSVSYNCVGDVLRAQGLLAAALENYQKSLAIRERLAKAEPDNTEWQCDLALSYSISGDILRAQGQLLDALQLNQKSLEIRKRLAEAEPGNPALQSDLSVSYNCVGDVLRAKNKLSDALQSYQMSLTIREQLANTYSDNAGWQRDLAVSCNIVGDAYLAQGQLIKALDLNKRSLAIRKQLVDDDSQNTGLKSDLSLSYNSVGDALSSQGQLAAALESYQESLNIRSQLAKTYPDNAGWQRDFAISTEKVGKIMQEHKRWPEAAVAFIQVVAISRPWVEKADAEVQWQSLFAVGTGGCWEVLRDAPSGEVTLERSQVLADLSTARSLLRKLNEQGKLISPMDKHLPWIELLVAEAEVARQK